MKHTLGWFDWSKPGNKVGGVGSLGGWAAVVWVAPALKGLHLCSQLTERCASL